MPWQDSLRQIIEDEETETVGACLRRGGSRADEKFLAP